MQRALFLENDREMEVAHTVAASAGDTHVSFMFACFDILESDHHLYIFTIYSLSGNCIHPFMCISLFDFPFEHE